MAIYDVVGGDMEFLIDAPNGADSIARPKRASSWFMTNLTQRGFKDRRPLYNLDSAPAVGIAEKAM